MHGLRPLNMSKHALLNSSQVVVDEMMLTCAGAVAAVCWHGATCWCASRPAEQVAHLVRIRPMAGALLWAVCCHVTVCERSNLHLEHLQSTLHSAWHSIADVAGDLLGQCEAQPPEDLQCVHACGS